MLELHKPKKKKIHYNIHKYEHLKLSKTVNLFIFNGFRASVFSFIPFDFY